MPEKSVSAEMCQDVSVTKHDYRVTVSHTMGSTILESTYQAGSKAHAALLMGIELITTLLMEGAGDEVSMHNIADHLIVDVQLVV